MLCNRSKTRDCCSSFLVTNPVLTHFRGKFHFLIQFDISVPNYSEEGYFLTVNKLDKTQLKILKNKLYKILTFNFCFILYYEEK